MLGLKWRSNFERQYKLARLILENEILNTIIEIVNSLILDKSKLTSVLQVLDDGKTHSFHGQFPRLVEGFRNGSLIRPGISDTINRYAMARVAYGIFKIHEDLSSIITICHMINYQKELHKNGRLDDEMWNYYSSEDIDLFFMRHNFIYDKISEVIRAATDNYLKVRDQSFSRLLEQVNNNEIKMDDDFSKLVKWCDWHPDLCNTGVGIQNGEDETTVKMDSDEIMFDVFAFGCGPTSNVWTSIVHLPFPLQKDRGYTNFYLFAGVYVGYLFWYLEELSKAIIKPLNVNDLDSKSIFCHPGLALIYDWIKLVVST